jgi:hypothetical protein
MFRHKEMEQHIVEWGKKEGNTEVPRIL